MARESASIDITTLPALAELVAEVQRTRRPRILRRADQAEAVLMPLPPKAKRRSTGRVLTETDPLFGLIGIGDSGIPGGISGKKHEALARLRHT